MMGRGRECRLGEGEAQKKFDTCFEAVWCHGNVLQCLSEEGRHKAKVQVGQGEGQRKLDTSCSWVVHAMAMSLSVCQEMKGGTGR